jgi:hypothetical protein
VNRLAAAPKTRNRRDECLMTSIYQYFTDKLGTARADDTSRQYRSTATLPAMPPEASTSGLTD